MIGIPEHGEELPVIPRQQEAEYAIKRATAILQKWPITAQLEAITERDAGNPEKYQNLLSFISETKSSIPKG